MNLKYLNIIIDRALHLATLLFVLLALWVGTQVFLLATFRIPSDSMEPTLTEGDIVAVWKPTLGARLFNLDAAMRLEPVAIRRMPGVRSVKRGDVLVFNFPYPNDWGKVEMHILRYYVKRCIGLPGDRLTIREGAFHVEGVKEPLGNVATQKLVGRMAPKDFAKGVYLSFPYDSILDWNIQTFGPFYIPKAGDTMPMDRSAFALYRKLIAWEQGDATVEYRDSAVWLNGKPIDNYLFRKNYYFVAGDNSLNSQDSRYWGLLPEEYIVGKVAFVWRSTDPYTGRFRWERFLLPIK